jgi:hypothetical protein
MITRVGLAVAVELVRNPFVFNLDLLLNVSYLILSDRLLFTVFVLHLSDWLFELFGLLCLFTLFNILVAHLLFDWLII